MTRSSVKRSVSSLRHRPIRTESNVISFRFTVLLTFIIAGFAGIPQVTAQDFGARFEHQALVVSDLDSSAQFYRRVLGLREITNETGKPTRRWFSLGGSLQLHLLQDEMEGVALNKSIHTALAISDFDGFIANLRSRGITFYDWPGNVDRITTRPDGIRQVYIRDPDGYWIEINSARN